jgi:hypothetical protein
MSSHKPGDRYMEWLNIADHGDQMFKASREAYEATGRGFWVTSDEEQVKALGKREAMYYAASRMPDLLRRFVDDGLVGAGDPASGNFKAMVDTYDPTTEFVVVGCEDDQLFVHVVTGHEAGE